MIEQSCIERVKDAANIKEVVEQYVTLKRDGAGYVGSCPFHNEKTPSFKVTPAKNMYKCFGCGASGDSIEFVMKRENVDYLTAIRKLADKYRITLEEVKEQPKNYVKPPQQVQPLTKNSLDYFLSRGIRMETLVAAKVTSDVKWMPKAKKEVEVICFTQMCLCCYVICSNVISANVC